MRLPQHAQDLAQHPQRRWALAALAVATLLFLGYFMFGNETVAAMSVFHIGAYCAAGYGCRNSCSCMRSMPASLFWLC